MPGGLCDCVAARSSFGTLGRQRNTRCFCPPSRPAFGWREGWRGRGTGDEFCVRPEGFPLSFTARAEAESRVWRRQFLQTFLERDLQQLGVTIPAAAPHRFWNMVAHYHGQTWNAAELARALAINEATARRYLDLMTGVFMVRQLPPWFENLKKRQVTAPKVYVRDSGVRGRRCRAWMNSCTSRIWHLAASARRGRV